MHLLTYDLDPKTTSFPFSITSLNTLGSFIFELCCRQTDRQSAWVIKAYLILFVVSHIQISGLSYN